MKVKKILFLFLSLFVLIVGSCSSEQYVEKVIVTNYKGFSEEYVPYVLTNKVYPVNMKTYKVNKDLKVDNEENYYYVTMTVAYYVKVKEENKNLETYRITLEAKITSMGNEMDYWVNYDRFTIKNTLKLKKLDTSELDITYITSVTDKVEIIY